MKLLCLALTVALLFTAAEALDCHRCVPKTAAEKNCDHSVETCSPERNGCVALTFTREPFGRFQKCMSLEDCKLLQLNAYIKVNCCTEDMCNTL